MIVSATAIEGVHTITLEPRRDERGSFTRVYCEREFAAAGLAAGFVQANAAVSALAGTLRGLHHQLEPQAETKVVRCVRGALFDVVVDVREGSSTRGAWLGFELDASGPMLYVPPGCAHGYLTLADDTEVGYLTSAFYAPELERGVRWDDPGVGIRWPRQPVLISERDRSWPALELAR